jgi:molecular chaperone DnaK (HSP70)
MPRMSAPTDPIVGIDLGTTYSLVAIADWPGPAAPRTLPDEQGRALLPSVVRFEESGEVVVGWPARQSAVERPGSTVSSVKRLMGRGLDDARADVGFLPYELVEGEGRTARVRLPWGRVVSPQEVSAYVLRELKRRAEAALGVPVARAVVTVPAYFDDAQRQATRDAGRLAGLEVVRVVNEPTAAALAYGLGLRADKVRVVVVYDLGGGTFDVSVLRLTPSADPAKAAGGAEFFEVLATAGDTRLGGDDFDRLLVELFTREIRAGQGMTAGAGVASAGGASAGAIDAAVLTALTAEAERVKIELSARERARARVELLGGRVYEREVTRDEFESMIAPLVDRSIAATARALRDAGRRLDGQAVDSVVLVGGSTRIPLVRRKVADALGLEPYTALDPDRVVALGAAVQGSVLSRAGGPDAGALLLDVIPLSLGIETLNGAVAKLIVRNSTVPARATERFSTSVDNQTSIRLSVYQGEREMAADCRLLGTFNLAGIPPMPAGIPQVEVEFAVDANAVLTVRAVERRSGKRASIQIVPNHGLSRDEVDRLERESFAHAREDMTRHRLADLIANARLDLRWIERPLSQHADKLAPSDRDAIRSAMSELAGFIARAEADWKSVNPDAFHKAKETLDRASVRLHELAIAESLRRG